MNYAQDNTQKGLQYRNFGIFRLILAALVLVQHVYAALAPASMEMVLQPLEVGSIAVLVFFALSGFVIVEAAEFLYQGRAGAFLTNRFLRVFPHFWVAVAMALLIYGAYARSGSPGLPHGNALPAEHAFSSRNVAFNFLGILPLSDRFISFNLIEIAWSVRVEMAFYGVVALGLVCLAFARRVVRTRAPSFAAILLVFSLACVPLYALALQGRGIAMFQFLPYFVFGGALFYSVSRRSSWAYAIALLALAGIDLHFLLQPTQHKVLGFTRDVTFQFALLTGLLLVMAVLAYLPSRRIEALDRQLGDMTYPLYIYHLNVILAVYLFMPEASGRAMALAIAASLLVALGLHKLIDPLVDRLRNAVRGRKI